MLDRILAHKRVELARARAERPLEEVRAQAADAPSPRDLVAALLSPGPMPRPRIIAEIKRRSPSAGPLRPEADAVEIAQRYMLAGAAAISVLTDEEFFGGSLGDLSAVRAGTRLPVLRKDFVLDVYEIWRARAAGADAVLLIAAALEPSALAELAAACRDLGMTALVEIHAETELPAALDAKPQLLGINHRDLRTFAMDRELFARLRPLVPAELPLVAESGIRTAEDVRRLGAAGAAAVLVGESLMRAPDPGEALRALLVGSDG